MFLYNKTNKAPLFSFLLCLFSLSPHAARGTEFDKSPDSFQKPSLKPQTLFDNDDTSQSENHNIIMGDLLPHEKIKKVDPIAYLQSALKKSDFNKISSSWLNDKNTKGLVLSILASKIGFRGQENLTTHDYDLMGFYKVSLGDLEDTWSLSQIIEGVPSSPDKTGRGAQTVIPTPVSKRYLSRHALAGVDLSALRTRRFMQTTRENYDAEHDDYRNLKRAQKARTKAAQEELTLLCGATRIGYAVEKSFVRQGLTEKLMSNFAAWLPTVKGSPTLRADMTSYFLTNLSTYLVELYVHEDLGLRFFFNPQDINLSLRDTFGRNNLERLESGLNPIGFELHHVVQRQKNQDLILYLPTNLHVDDIHPFNGYTTEMNAVGRSDFNKSRLAANFSLYALALSKPHLFAD